MYLSAASSLCCLLLEMFTNIDWTVQAYNLYHLYRSGVALDGNFVVHVFSSLVLHFTSFPIKVQKEI